MSKLNCTIGTEDLTEYQIDKIKGLLDCLKSDYKVSKHGIISTDFESMKRVLSEM